MTVRPSPINHDLLRVHPITLGALLDTMSRWLSEGSKRSVFYVNAWGIDLYQRDPLYRAAVDKSDLVFCDGFGAIVVGRMLRLSIPERMTPPDWIDEFLERLGELGPRVFLIGDTDEVADQCARALVARHPSLGRVGFHSGFFNEHGPSNDRLVGLVNEAKPHLVLVGMGMPRQERWIIENGERLPPALYVAVGGLFRYYAGIERRGPKFLTDHGAEWLFRLAEEPVKRFYRYCIALPRVLSKALSYRMRRQ